MSARPFAELPATFPQLVPQASARLAAAPAAARIRDIELPLRADLRWRKPVPEPAFEAFRLWTELPRAARNGADLRHGVDLARKRRQEMLELITDNPRRALELDVPDAVRRVLPAEIQALLEEPVDARGDLLVQAATLDGTDGCRLTRTTTLTDGRIYETHVYGRRGAMPTRDNIAIHGIALDDMLALSELPGRILEPAEVQDALAAGVMVEELPGFHGGGHPAVADTALHIALGDKRMVRCGGEGDAIVLLLEEEDDEWSGSNEDPAEDLDGVIAASPWTEGQKSLLIIRVDFPDFPGQAVGDSTLQQLIRDMNAVYSAMSSGKSSFALPGQGSTITPTVRMPRTSSNYSSWTSLSKILDDARVAAAAAGYDYRDYSLEVVVTGSKPLVPGVAGVARVGARGAWLCNSQWNLKTCAHEVGHNFGLVHSGTWKTSDGSVIGPGKVADYGNVFDIMGVGSSPHASRHFGASLKEYLDWIPTSDLVKITANGTTTTRIRAMDKEQPDGNKRALAVDRPGSTNDYWIEHRQLYGTNHGMRDGVLVNWADIQGGRQQPLLLDMRPDTPEVTDAALPIGRTFSDSAAGVHITPVGRGTDADGVNWVDVTVNRGAFAGNLPPIASISATNANPAVNGSVTFNCAASDPNGDTLAYFWDWGNGTTTATNSPIASKSWPAAGIYFVQCTVSDMKGLTTTADYVIQVGGTGFFIEGKVKTIQGSPLQGIVVSATPGSAQTTTDAEGRYILTGLPAGSYTLTASSGLPDGFSNPVSVGPSLQGRNFTRQSYSLTWDANTGTGGAQDGGGNWAEGGGNWHNAETGANNRKWGNANLDAAVFGAGTDGNHAVTLAGTVQAGGGITFANSGYTLAGAPLLPHDGANNTSIRVMAGKTATLQSAITYLNNRRAVIRVESDAVLNLEGGASNSQYNFEGAGTVRLNAGTYTANVGNISAASVVQNGGTFHITPGNNVGYNVSSNSRDAHFILSGGTLNVNGNNTTPAVANAYLGIGNGTGISNTATMTIRNNATVNVGTTASRSGEIRIANNAESNGTLDIQGGSLTVGSGNQANRIYFFKSGSMEAPYLARMNQSGGTVIANGIQFGGDSGSYDPASSAILELRGGALYLGSQGITRGTAADDLAVAILLLGGTLGADQNWNSPLDMQLGDEHGGCVIRAQDNGGNGRNIVLSGNLSDAGDSTGALIKSGVADLILRGTNNSYSGGTTVQSGRLFIANAGALPPSGAVRVNAGTLDFNAGGSPVFPQDITLASGANLALRQSATLTNVTLPGSGLVVFNSDDQPTVAFRLGGNHTLTGTLAIQVGGGPGTPGPVTLAGTLSGNGGLHKTQAGTLVLTGTNTYTGPTTVAAGTLALAAGATASPITVASGARLEFTLGSTPTSSASLTLSAGHSITIHGTPTLASYTLFATTSGITGSPQLASAIPDYQLRVVGGNELRLVQTGGNPYAIWSGGEAFHEDANADGVGNGLAFLLGAPHPHADARALLPSASHINGDLALSFQMRNAEHRGAAALAVQFSRDLGRSDPWTSVMVPDSSQGPSQGITFQITEGNPFHRVTVTLSATHDGGAATRFGRLHANGPPP